MSCTTACYGRKKPVLLSRKAILSRGLKLRLQFCTQEETIWHLASQDGPCRFPLNHTTHCCPAVFGFSAWVFNATTTGGSHGPHMTRIWSWPAPNIVSCWDRAPRDPRGVPWDRIFLLKNFLISSSNDLILWVLWIGYAKNAKNQEKLLILAYFLSNRGKCWKWPVFLDFWQF